MIFLWHSFFSVCNFGYRLSLVVVSELRLWSLAVCCLLVAFGTKHFVMFQIYVCAAQLAGRCAKPVEFCLVPSSGARLNYGVGACGPSFAALLSLFAPIFLAGCVLSFAILIGVQLAVFGELVFCRLCPFGGDQFSSVFIFGPGLSLVLKTVWIASSSLALVTHCLWMHCLFLVVPLWLSGPPGSLPPLAL